MPKVPVALAAVAMLLGPAQAAHPQPCTPAWSDEFYSGSVGGTIRAMVLFDEDGDGPLPPMVYAGGRFSPPGTGAENIARWTGRGWEALPGGGVPVVSGDEQVLTLSVLDPDGPGPETPGLYVAGRFDEAGGRAARNVARWDATGWSPLGSLGGSIGNTVDALAVFDEDGPGPMPPALYAGGTFDSDGAGPIRKIARWDGAAWHEVGGGLPCDFRAGVRALAVFDPDGAGPASERLYAGGDFTSVEGEYIAYLQDGDWHRPGGGVSAGGSAAVRDLVVFDTDGTGPAPAQLFAAGHIHYADGNLVPGIARWDGQNWTGVNGGIENGDVFDLHVADLDGLGPNPQRLIAAGNFRTAGGQPVSQIAAWDGSSWSGFEPGIAAPENPSIGVVLAVETPEGEISLLVGGSFTRAGEFDVLNFAQWLGGRWLPVGNSLMSTGHTVALCMAEFDPDGQGPVPAALYVGGEFNTAGPVAAHHIARWDGSAWSAVGEGTNGEVRAMLAFDPDGHGPVPGALYAGGTFTTVGGAPASYIARWDGASWAPVGSGFNDEVRALFAFDEDGLGPMPEMLYAGGDFTSAGDVTAVGVARWDGSAWSGVGSGLNGLVRDFERFDHDGPGSSGPSLFACGDFLDAGPQRVNRIARWDGSAWVPLGTGLNDVTRSMEVFDPDADGPQPPALYVAGYFTRASGQEIRYLAVWDGVAWTEPPAAFGGPVLALTGWDPDEGGPLAEELLIGGRFSSIAGDPVGYLVRWDGESFGTFDQGLGSWVYAIVPFATGRQGQDLYVVGEFDHAGGRSSQNFARWETCLGGCAADCDGDGVLELADFVCFRDLYVAADPAADLDGDGTLTLADFIAFRNGYAAGCP